MKRLVIGILAHVDSGKTTLSEGLLYRSGAIRKLGRVDHGDTFLDSHSLERNRGITIFSKQAILRLENTEFTLLDTPGHVDFSTEMERTLQVLDYAVLVISGTDGVQSHTETLWRLLLRYHIPTFLFINKMDLPTDQAKLMENLKQRLSDNCVDFSPHQAARIMDENLAMCDLAMMDQFLETGKIERSAVIDAIAHRRVFPCYFGSALKLEGVDEFLSGLEQYTQSPLYGDAFGVRVFKIADDGQGSRLTYLKITGGYLKVKDTLTGQDENRKPWTEKVNQIRLYSGAKFQTIDTALSGTVCAVTGLTHTYPREGLGMEIEFQAPMLQPVLTYRIELPSKTDPHTVLPMLRQLEEEDPQLHVVWNKSLQEIHVRLMGEIQLEILKSLMKERFQLEVGFGQGEIIYQETIAQPVEGVGHFEPLRHYAEVHLLLEPGERGSGLQFASACREDDLDRNWQHLVLTHLAEKKHLGVLTGSPITDIKITLVAGRAHKKHTEGGDFRQATYRAVRQGLKSTTSILLEPWYQFRLELPQELVGHAMSDLQRMGGKFSAPELEKDGETVLTGSAPVSLMRGYQAEVTSYTRGKGRLFCELKGYEPCHNPEEVIAAIGYDSDNDVDNPADSVFCAHGSGFIVKWDQVPSYMHLESVTDRNAGNREPEAENPHRAADYCAMLAEDAELMRIFEQTYGPIRRRTHSAVLPVRRSGTLPKSAARARALPEGPEYLLVDGYNIIFAWEDLNALAKENIDAARTRLIHILCNYQGFRQCEVILVFDAYKVKGNPGTVEKFHNISVVYTKEAETADMYIEKVTCMLGKKHRIRVATSDALEQMIILGHGALRISASAFREEVDAAEKSIRSFLEQ